jgi:threonine dehydrogenase-like Zn-dependent dehydrogenase
MHAVTWHGRRDVRVEAVPDPCLEGPTGAIIRVTSRGLCGSDVAPREVAAASIGAGVG